MADWEKMQDEAINKLLKNNKSLRLGNSNEFDYERIAFGIPALASQIVVNAQKVGGLTAWIDTELSWDSAWNEKCGVDTSKLIVSQPTNGEEALDNVRELMQAGVDVIVLDSIAGLVPTTVAEEEFSYNPIAWQARFVNSSLPKLLPNLQYGSALVAINQVRASMGPVALDNMPGGMAQAFFAHFLMQVRRSGWIEENKQRVGFDMEVRLRKTKVGGENWRSATVPFRVEGGIDIVESYIREGVERKLIVQGGAWYTYKENKVQGLNGLKAFFMENDTLFKELQDELTS